MKPLMHKTFRLLQAPALVAMALACKNQDVEPLAPYKLNSLKSVQLVAAPLSKPAAVAVSPSAVSTSALWTSASTDIVFMASSGQMTSGLTKASDVTNSALSDARVTSAQLVGSFTPDVINNLATQRVLPSGLQRIVTDIVANAGVQSYLNTFSYGKVNGREIGLVYKADQSNALMTVIQPVAATPVNYTGSDASYKSANDTYDARIKELDAVRLKQIDVISAAFEKETTTITSDINSGLSDNTTKYTTLISSAKQKLLNTLTSLNTAKSKIGDSNYNALAALAYIQYANQINQYDQLQMADKNVQTAVKDERTIANRNARDTDLNKVNGDFNAAMVSIFDILRNIINQIHQQGNGR